MRKKTEMINREKYKKHLASLDRWARERFAAQAETASKPAFVGVVNIKGADETAYLFVDRDAHDTGWPLPVVFEERHAAWFDSRQDARQAAKRCRKLLRQRFPHVPTKDIDIKVIETARIAPVAETGETE